jgi:hypothetical protein
MLNMIKKFFASAPNSIRGALVPEELLRSIMTALGSGSLLGLLLLALQAVLNNAAAIFPNPIVASLAIAILTIVVDQVRRLEHGVAPTPTPPPIPAPVVVIQAT